MKDLVFKVGDTVLARGRGESKEAVVVGHFSREPCPALSSHAAGFCCHRYRIFVVNTAQCEVVSGSSLGPGGDGAVLCKLCGRTTDSCCCYDRPDVCRCLCHERAFPALKPRPCCRCGLHHWNSSGCREPLPIDAIGVPTLARCGSVN